MLKDEVAKIHKLIEENNNFIILVHRFPEGDALGSQLALGQALIDSHKDVDMLHIDPIPSQYKFMPGSSIIKIHEAFKTNYNVGFVLDSSDFERTDYSKEDRQKIKYLVNIDHHLSNNYFGDFNFVNPNASSTGEMIYRLFQDSNFCITRDIATNIYTAIVTDTGSFRYSNTTAETLMIASKLVNHGIDIAWANENIFEIRTISKLKLWGEVLSKIETKCNDLISILTVTQEMLLQTNAEYSDTENIINYGLSIIGVEVSLLLKELSEDLYKVSFRSKGKINVAKVAEFFGGGGHFRASGCKISGHMNKIKNELLNIIENELKNANLLK
jgi:bifunctional oligoribonuclease and PAP phosphatase NrnA